MTPIPTTEHEAAITVLLRRVFENADGEPTVCCEREGKPRALVDCRTCRHSAGLHIDGRDNRAFLECTFAPSTHDPSTGRSKARMLCQHTIGDIMTSPIVSLHGGASVNQVAQLMLDRNVGTVVVTGEDDTPVGIVSRSDLVRVCFAEAPQAWSPSAADPDRPETPTGVAADLMTPLLLSLPADAPIARAAALMAYEGIHHILVTDVQGATVGMASSLDVMTWLARQDGFVLPIADK